MICYVGFSHIVHGVFSRVPPYDMTCLWSSDLKYEADSCQPGPHHLLRNSHASAGLPSSVWSRHFFFTHFVKEISFPNLCEFLEHFHAEDYPMENWPAAPSPMLRRYKSWKWMKVDESWWKWMKVDGSVPSPMLRRYKSSNLQQSSTVQITKN